MITWLWTALVAALSPAVLLVLGLVLGRTLQARQLSALVQRERQLLQVPVLAARRVDARPVRRAWLASGSVVVSADYFTRLVASLRMLIGGEVGGYSGLLEQARREAILRMKETCPEADIYIGCRIVTAAISTGQEGLLCFEVMAYATAIVWEDADAYQPAALLADP